MKDSSNYVDWIDVSSFVFRANQFRVKFKEYACVRARSSIVPEIGAVLQLRPDVSHTLNIFGDCNAKLLLG